MENVTAERKPLVAVMMLWLGRGLLIIVLGLTWCICFFVFRILNRTTVHGWQFAGPRRRCLIVSNHQSLIDSFLVNWVIYYPSILWHPDLAPAHLADKKNFSTHRILNFAYDALRVIPVGRKEDGSRNDRAAFYAARAVLKAGRALHVFAEGTRSPDDQLRPIRTQIGSLALIENVTVIPVYFTGMHEVQPYRKKIGDPPVTIWRYLFGAHTEWLLDVRAGKRVTIVIGQPMTPKELVAIAGTDKHSLQSARVAEAIMERISDLQLAHGPTPQHQVLVK